MQGSYKKRKSLFFFTTGAFQPIGTGESHDMSDLSPHVEFADTVRVMIWSAFVTFRGLLGGLFSGLIGNGRGDADDQSQHRQKTLNKPAHFGIPRFLSRPPFVYRRAVGDASNESRRLWLGGKLSNHQCSQQANVIRR
jgi:hypothetical protein